jgi:hypothetical protein
MTFAIDKVKNISLLKYLDEMVIFQGAKDPCCQKLMLYRRERRGWKRRKGRNVRDIWRKIISPLRTSRFPASANFAVGI